MQYNKIIPQVVPNQEVHIDYDMNIAGYPPRASRGPVAVPFIARYKGHINPTTITGNDMRSGDYWEKKPTPPGITISAMTISGSTGGFTVTVTTPVTGASGYLLLISERSDFLFNLPGYDFKLITGGSGLVEVVTGLPINKTYYCAAIAIVDEEDSVKSQRQSKKIITRYDYLRTMTPQPDYYWPHTESSLTVMSSIEHILNPASTSKNGVYFNNPASVSISLDPLNPTFTSKRMGGTAYGRFDWGADQALPTTGLVIRQTLKGLGGGDDDSFSLGYTGSNIPVIEIGYGAAASKKLIVYARSTDNTVLINQQTTIDVYDNIAKHDVCLMMLGSNVQNTPGGYKNWYLLVDGVIAMDGAYQVNAGTGVYTHKALAFNRAGIAARSRAADDQIQEIDVNYSAIWGLTNPLPSLQQMLELNSL